MSTPQSGELAGLQLGDALTFIDAAPDGIVVVDAAGTIVLANRQMEDLFGYSRSELRGQKVELLVPAALRSGHVEQRRRYFREPRARAMGAAGVPLFGERKNGTRFPVDISLSPLATAAGAMVVAAVRDATAREAAAEELRRSRDQLEVRVQERTEQLYSVIQTAGVAIVAVDREGRIQEWNREAQSIFGWTREEALGKHSVEDLLPRRERPAAQALLRRLLAGEELRDHEQVVLCKDGTERLVLWNSTTRRHPRTREPLGLIACGQDITERRREAREREELKRRAEQQGRLAEIGAITTKIVHDLGNPLTGLVMQAQLVERAVARGAPAAELAEAAAQILGTGRHLEAMMREFRFIARGQELAVEEMDIPAFLREVADAWKGFAQDRSIALRVEVAADLPPLRGDPIKLYRVLDNLIKNAVEAVNAGPGEVVLRAEPAGSDRLRVCVEDSGPGVPGDVDVFQMFETTKAEGTGLGLPVCRQIVQAHGGRIYFAAREPGGTVFTVELPLTPTSHQSSR